MRSPRAQRDHRFTVSEVGSMLYAGTKGVCVTVSIVGLLSGVFFVLLSTVTLNMTGLNNYKDLYSHQAPRGHSYLKESPVPLWI